MQKKHFPIACIIMASGIAKRFGSNKLLTDVNGKPMIKHILAITEKLFTKRIVVTRHQSIKAICDAHSISCVMHNKPYVSDTVRIGTTFLDQQDMQGLLFATADQPLLKQASIINLCESFLDAPDKIHRLYAGDTPGNPIIFPIALAGELKNLPQDKGGSVLAKKYPELVVRVQVQDKNELFDVDTQADAQILVQLMQNID